VLGLAAIAVAARGSMLKGLIAGLLGLLFSFVGFAPIGGNIRYVFGQPTLYDGIGIVPVLIGLFAVSETLRLLVANESVATDVQQLKFGQRQVWEGVVYTLKKPFLVLRSSLVGTGIGIVPAVGGTLASFLAYFQAAKTVKDSKFGRGDPRGVLAPEAANNAKDAGAALPTLAFGIPGSADWAIILGAMIIHGVTPGPNLIRDNPDVVWVAILVIFFAAFVASAVGIVAAPSLIQVTRLRPSLLAPIVLALAVTGAFGIQLRTIDVLVALAFGLLGYAMKVIGMPVIPLILGLILGPIVERAYLQTLSTFGGLSGFVTRPISLTLVLLTVGVIAYELFAARRERKRHGRAVEEGVRSAIRPTSLIVVASMGAVAVFAFVLAQDFNPQSRQFPSMAAMLLTALAAVYLAIALVPPLRRRFGALIADGGGMEQSAPQAPERVPSQEALRGGDADAAESGADLDVERSSVTTAVPADATEPDADQRAGRIRLAKSVLLILGLALGTILFGLAASVVVVLVLFFRFVGGESWRMTMLLSAGTVVALYVLFVSILGVPIEGGLLLPY
jgi:TctA family transporter